MNKEIKKEFLAQYDNKSYNIIMDSVMRYEDEVEKDCSEFTEAEIRDYLKSVGASSVQVLKNYASIMRSYTAYRLKNGDTKDGINHYDNIGAKDYEDALDRVKISNLYVPYEKLMHILSVLEEPRDKFIFLAYYEGLANQRDGISNISMLKEDAIKDDHFILLDGSIFYVSELLIMVARESAQQKIIGVDMSAKNEGNFIVPQNTKAFQDEEHRSSFIRRRASKLNKEFGFNIKLTNLALSGMLKPIIDIMNSRDLNFFEAIEYPEAKLSIERYGYKNKPTARLYTLVKMFLP